VTQNATGLRAGTDTDTGEIMGPIIIAAARCFCWYPICACVA